MRIHALNEKEASLALFFMTIGRMHRQTDGQECNGVMEGEKHLWKEARKLIFYEKFRQIWYLSNHGNFDENSFPE